MSTLSRSTMWSVVGVVVARTVVVARGRVVVCIVVGQGVCTGQRPRGRTILPDMGAHWRHSVAYCARVAPNNAHRAKWRLDLEQGRRNRPAQPAHGLALIFGIELPFSKL